MTQQLGLIKAASSETIDVGGLEHVHSPSNNIIEGFVYFFANKQNTIQMKTRHDPEGRWTVALEGTVRVRSRSSSSPPKGGRAQVELSLELGRLLSLELVRVLSLKRGREPLRGR